MGGAKRDINLLAAAGGKKSIDIKTSFSTIAIIVIILVIGILGFLIIQSYTKKVNLTAENEFIEGQLNNPTEILRLQKLKEKEAIYALINESVISGNNILKYKDVVPELFPHLKGNHLLNIQDIVSANTSTISDMVYEGNILTLYCKAATNMSSEIRNQLALTQLFKKVTVIEIDEDIPIEVVEGEVPFAIECELKLLHEFISTAPIKPTNVTVSNIRYSSGVITFNADAPLTTEGYNALYSDYLVNTLEFLMDEGYFLNVSVSGLGEKNQEGTRYQLTDITCKIAGVE